ncbi:MAG: integrin [Sandaracinaceae bacterium]|nr:integrin [Sandaracinaceae bacterium]
MSSNTMEGTVSAASLTFSTMNWSTPQTVTVTGVDDFVADGNIAYTTITGVTTSADPVYSGLAVSDVSVTNNDNDVAGISVSPTSGLTTTEPGGTATFTIVLTSQPTANVRVSMMSSAPTEGTISLASVTFSTANWSAPQTVTITGVDDFVLDGNIAYTIITGAAVSADPVYSGLAVADVSVTNRSLIHYIKASNTEAGDYFGVTVALSSDGNTLAVGAYLESSNATGINGNQADNSIGHGAGAVYVFTRAGSAWSQQAYIKASNTQRDDFGNSLALSSDGNTLAVGALIENSNAIGIDGDQNDHSAAGAGAVYVFARASSVWSQQAYVKASNTDAGDVFGYSVALSSDGSTLAVGARSESSNATGVGGNQADNSANRAGAVYVFTRAASVWTQQAYLKASNAAGGDGSAGWGDWFGAAVALSSDGNTLAVGADGEGSKATGVGGNQADNTAINAGAVYVFTRSASIWTQQAYVKASNTDAGDSFGTFVALSSDGNTLAVGAPVENSNATGIDGNEADNSAASAGAVYVFTRAGSVWTHQAYVKASNTGANDSFGVVALSSDGNTLAVGAYREYSNATGINGNQADNSAPQAGAVYTFARAGSAWFQQAYVKASNTGASDWFGAAVALSADATVLAVGAYRESSNATGIDGTQTDNSAPTSGAVYVY